MTDRIITLGLADASPETRQAAEAAQIGRRLAALERAGDPNPVGTILPYAGAVSGANDTVVSTQDDTWAPRATNGGGFNYGYTIGAIASNPTYVFARQFFATGSFVTGPITRITKSTGASVNVGSAGSEAVGGSHDGSVPVASQATAFSKTNVLTADDSYVYYAQPSDTDADVRRVYRISPTASSGTIGTSYGQCPSGRYMTHLAVTPTAVTGSTRYLYAVLDNDTLVRSTLGASLSFGAAVYTAPTGVSITGIAVASNPAPTDHTAGHIYLSLSNNTIIRINDASPAVTQETWTLDRTPYGVSVSNSHIYFNDIYAMGRITLTAGAGADVIEYEKFDTPDLWSARHTADYTGTPLYYMSSGTYVGRINNAEATTAAYVDPPDGYIRCDGASVSRETYSDLFNVLGTTYGTADSASFNLPLRTDSKWIAYSPTLTAFTTNPTGPYTAVSYYTQIGDTVHYTGLLTMAAGGASSYGSGVYFLSYPITPASTTTFEFSGSGFAIKNSTTAATYACNARHVMFGPFPTISLYYTTTQIAHNAPFTFTAGDQLQWSITYRANAFAASYNARQNGIVNHIIKY